MTSRTDELLDHVLWAAQESAVFADERSPFAARVTPGRRGLVLMTGENASGKSLLLRMVLARLGRDGRVPVSLSIRERAGGGLRAAFMFGDEAEQSTGATSVQAIRAAFEGNLDREQGSVLALDEPELGLSQGYATALGHYIGEQALRVPAACAGVLVVTHSRPLASALVESFGADPTFVHVSGTPQSLRQWLTEPESRSVEDLLALPDAGLERRRAVYDLTRRPS